MNRILVVEDNAQSLYLLESVLQSRGHQVIAAVNGEEALRLARRDRPDIIVSDIMMPVMNGFRLCREVKNDVRLRTIPFIFYTATFVEKADEQLALSLGASRFIVKPVDGTQFLQILDEVLDEHRQGVLPISQEQLEPDDTILEMYDHSVTRKLAETVEKLRHERKALLESERMLKEAQEIAHLGHWKLDLRSQALQWSEEIYRILGLKPHDFPASHERFLTFVHADDRATVNQAYQRSLMKRTQCDLEYRLLPTTGEVKFVHERYQTLFDDEGQPICLMGTVQDITQRREAEAALRESEGLLRAILKAIPDPMVMYEAEGHPQFVNPAFSEVFGWSIGELREGNIPFVPKDLQSITATYMDKLYESGHWEKIETRRQTKQGQILDVVMTAARVTGKEGEPVGIVTHLTDITQRRALETRIKQAQKMEAIGNLAGGIAHDFNNLLQVVLGCSEMALLRCESGQPIRPDLQEIKAAAQSASELTQGLLTFSRHSESRLKPVDLNHEIRRVGKMMSRLLPKMIDIRFELGDCLRQINGDPAQLQQLLMNLSVNARDAMPDGGTLTIETRNVELDEQHFQTHLETIPGSYVLTSVTDTGQGMDKRTLERIFEPFYTTKERGGGTGLGLSIVYGIVKSHEGSIVCRSAPRQGTTFEVYLPAITEEHECGETATPGSIVGGTETVLLVDDEEAIRRLGIQILERFGYSLMAASNGIEGLDLFMKERACIDLVILDLAMPGLGGRDCLKEILKIDPSTKVLVASGYASDGQVELSVEEGAKASIRKPYEVRQLLETVRSVLDARDT